MRCSVCRAKGKKAIELALNRGLTQAKVAAKYRLLVSAVQRHAKNCMCDRRTRELERDIRRVDHAIRAPLEKNAGANIAPMLAGKYDLLDRLESAGGLDSGTKISVEYQSQQYAKAIRRALGVDDGVEIVGQPVAELPAGVEEKPARAQAEQEPEAAEPEPEEEPKPQRWPDTEPAPRLKYVPKLRPSKKDSGLLAIMKADNIITKPM
jgi:hypothetical protein